MRQNTIFSYVQKIGAVLGAAALLVLAACGGIDTATETAADGNTVSVQIAVDAETRTALPTLARDDFTKFVLTCDGTAVGTWETTATATAYLAMNSSRVSLAAGSHTFVLTATATGGATYAGTLTQTVADGTVLNFTLSLASIPTTGSGTVSVAVDISAVKSQMDHMTINLYNSADEVNYRSATKVGEQNTVYGTSTAIKNGRYTYEKEGLASGQYILEFIFYNSNGLMLGFWPELVTVLPGRISTSEHAITSLVKTYSITYVKNNGSSNSTANYTIYSDVTLLPLSERTGYTFEGWFTSEDGGTTLAETPMEGWAAFTRSGDLTLYAKWTPLTFPITYYNADGTAFDGTHEDGYATIHTYGTETVLDSPLMKDEDLSFAGWYTGTKNDDGTVTLGTVRYEKLGATDYLKGIELYATSVRGTFHVSATGSDAAYVDGETAYGDGSSEHPYATIEKAIAAFTALNAKAAYTIVVHGVLTGSFKVYILSSAKASALTIRGATGNETDKLDGNANGTVLDVSTSVPVTLKNIAVTNGRTTFSYSAGGILLSEGTLTLAEGALVSGNVNEYNASSWFVGVGGGGIFVKKGSLVMEEGSQISNNTARNTGGGVFVTGYNGAASFTMNGGIIANNAVTAESTNSSMYYGGGGVYICALSSSYSTAFTMNGGEIKGNTVPNATANTNGGGGIYIYNYTSNPHSLKGGKISGNSAANGGGVFIQNGILDLAGCEISANTATSSGGALYYNGGTVNMRGSISIPAGDEAKNDVYLASNKYICVTGELTAASPVATLSPSSYAVDTKLFTTANLTQDIADKFAVKSDGTPWSIVAGTNGYATLQRTVYTITYKDKGGADFTGTLAEGAPVKHTYDTATPLLGAEKEGWAFQGWYKTPDCSGTAITEIAADEITADLTLYTYWTKAALTFKVEKSVIALARDASAEDGTVTITAAEGFTGYAWKIDNTAPSAGITGASVSADGRTLSFNRENMIKGISYVISVTAKDANGVKQSATVAVKKQEAE